MAEFENVWGERANDECFSMMQPYRDAAVRYFTSEIENAAKSMQEEEDNVCRGCDEEIDDCSCQRCSVCNQINPDGQRHVFCAKSCTERTKYMQGLIDYTD
jgi:CCR4-NOT transcriptional regulation complex NOT5 subunit